MGTNKTTQGRAGRESKRERERVGRRGITLPFDPLVGWSLRKGFRQTGERKKERIEEG